MRRYRIAGHARLQGGVRDEPIATLLCHFQAAIQRGDQKAAAAFKTGLRTAGRVVELTPTPTLRMMSRDVRLCREFAALYAARGYNPLPSRPDAKRPFVRYARYF
jgi:hypothetical protein